MSLTEQDESDLAALAAELGTPDSDARARKLAQENPEAADFLRQLRRICGSLRTYSETSPPPLAADQAAALADEIVTRVEHARAGKRLAIRNSWRWAGLAAVIVLAATAWFSLFDRTETVAEVIYIPVSTSLNTTSVAPPHRDRVRAGQLIDTGSGYAALNLAGGIRVAAAKGTRLAVQETGRVIDLQKGSIFFEAPSTIRIKTADAVISSEGGTLKAMVEAAQIKVYAGRATITRKDSEAQITTGQFCTWGPSVEGISVHAFSTEPPGWVTLPLEIAAKP